jgi:hypothetical protein
MITVQRLRDKDAREELRVKYRPSTVKVLFVGESPPSGGAFFYCANSNLYLYTQRAFDKVYEGQCGEGEPFLEFFKEQGCYLDDLCLDSINHLDEKLKKQMWRQGVTPLAERIRQMEPKPLRCIVVVKKIEWTIRSALQQAEASIIPLSSITFPTPQYGHHKKYIRELTQILRELIKNKILSEPTSIPQKSLTAH